MPCPRCQPGAVTKDGATPLGRQRFRCRSCWRAGHHGRPEHHLSLGAAIPATVRSGSPSVPTGESTRRTLASAAGGIISIAPSMVAARSWMAPSRRLAT